MAERKVREFLTSSGISDSDITYNNGRVMVKGRDFMGATPRADGSTYGDENQLNQAFNNYNFKDAMNTYQTKLNQPREQFSYNAQSDPLYQNALGAAQRSAQTAGNNATVRLGARGIGNSQQALTTENKIQQRAVADVNSNLLPQYMTQAYNQYKDRYAMDQDALKNQLNLAGTYNDLGQQGFNNDRLTLADNERTKQNNLDAARNVGNDLGRVLAPKSDWSNLYNQDDAPLNMDARKYADDMTQRAFDNKYKETAQGIQQQNANRLSAGGGSAGGSSGGASSVKNMSSAQFNDIADTLQKKYGVANYKKNDENDIVYDAQNQPTNPYMTDANGNPTISYTNTNNPDQKAKIVTEILNAGLSDDDTLKLLNKMGITEAEARELLGG